MATTRAALPIVAVKTARPPAARGTTGFTLVELMIALTVLGILIAAGLPSLGNLVRDQRVKTASSDIFASLIFARSEAIKRSADINIVRVNGSTDSDKWGEGWTVQDTAGNALKIQGAISGVKITVTTPDGAPKCIAYRRDGRVQYFLNANCSVPELPVRPFELRSPDSASITTRCVRLDPSGRPNIKVGC